MVNVKGGFRLALFNRLSWSILKMMEEFPSSPADLRAAHRSSSDSAAQGTELFIKTFMTSLRCSM